MKTLYTFGYLSGSISDLERWAGEGGLILDIRINPTSRNPAFRQGHLRRVLGDAYDWLPELGNPNYRSGGPPALAEEVAGIAALERIAEKHPKTVLLCACRDWRGCHRRLAAEAFEKRNPDWKVVHLEKEQAL